MRHDKRALTVSIELRRWTAALTALALITVAWYSVPFPAAKAASPPDPTTFSIRVEQGDTDTVAGWLQSGLDPNFEGDRGGTGLMIAAWDGNIAMMSLFVKHGADINRINGFKEQALMHAAWTGHLPAVSWLLDRGASVDGDPYEWSALHYAAFAGHDLIAKFLIQKGADVNARSNNGATPLMMAAHEGRDSMVKMLLDAGADRNIKNGLGENALTWAMRYEHTDIAKMVAPTDEYNDAAAKPKATWGEAIRPVAAPADVENMIQENRLARADGQARVLSAAEYRKILDSVAKLKPAVVRSKQPKGTTTKAESRKEKT